MTMRQQTQYSLLLLICSLLSILPCRANVGTVPPLPGGTLAPNTPPAMVPYYAPAMAPLPGGTLSPATPPHMAPMVMPALAPSYIPPPGQTFAPDMPPVFLPIVMPAMAPPPGETLSPNTPPAMLPMFMPAMIPPPGETFAPNTPPAMIPMMVPAMIPGPGETFAPNTPPAMIPILMPAMIPPPGETFAPNTPPAMIPMMVPAMIPPPGETFAPNTPPAMLPILMPATLPDLCFTNNGVYASTSGMANVIRWEYAVQVVNNNNTTTDDFRTNTLPMLEIAIADSLVPTLFDLPECRIDDTRRRRRSLQQQQDSSTIIGLSSRPVDIINSTNSNCGPPPCFAISGALTIFTMRRRQERSLQGEPTIFTENEVLVLQNIQDAMESGRFDSRGDIESVTYLGPFVDDRANAPEEEPSTATVTTTTNRRIAIIGGAVGGGTALLLLALGSFIIARNRRRDQLGNFPTVESNIIPDIEEPHQQIDDDGPGVPDIADEEFNNETAEDEEDVDDDQPSSQRGSDPSGIVLPAGSLA